VCPYGAGRGPAGSGGGRVYITPLTYYIHLPMKMEPTVSSETSAIRTQATGNYPKRNILQI